MTHGPEIPLLKMYTADMFAHVSRHPVQGQLLQQCLKSKTKANPHVTGSWLNKSYKGSCFNIAIFSFSN